MLDKNSCNASLYSRIIKSGFFFLIFSAQNICYKDEKRRIQNVLYIMTRDV